MSGSVTTQAPEPSATSPRPGSLVEVATWPPLEVLDVDGWQVGWSHGFTRRGNSALPPPAADDVPPDVLDRVLAQVEQLYADRGGPSIVRVSPDRSPALDDHLARRGYAPMAPTAVMVAPSTRATADGAGPPPPADRRPGPGPAGRSDAPPAARPLDGWEVTVATEPDDEWLVAWLGVKATTTTDVSTAARLLRGASARYYSARDPGGVVGVLRAAPAGEWVGLSCLAVAPRARRRGLAACLTRAALDHAPQPWAFLQVEESNVAACGLYAGLGFEVADRYVYRQR